MPKRVMTIGSLCDSEDSKEEEDSDDFDLEADVGITLE